MTTLRERTKLAKFLSRASMASDVTAIMVRAAGDGALSQHPPPSSADDCRDLAEAIIDELGDCSGYVEVGKRTFRVAGVDGFDDDGGVNLASAAARVPTAVARIITSQSRLVERSVGTVVDAMARMTEMAAEQAAQSSATMGHLLELQKRHAAAHLEAVKAREDALDRADERRAEATERELRAERISRWEGKAIEAMAHMAQYHKYGGPANLRRIATFFLGLPEDLQARVLEEGGAEGAEVIGELLADIKKAADAEEKGKA